MQQKKKVLPRPGRRLSAPAFPCEKLLPRSSAFEAHSSLKKLRPYLKRKAVSRIQLFGKAASAGSKHNNDGGNKGLLAKIMYPSLPNAFEQLVQIERHESDPSGAPSGDVSSLVNSVNDYEVTINDYSNQIHGLAVNRENRLDASCKGELEENFHDSRKAHRLHEAGNDNSEENTFNVEDVHLQKILEKVLRSHLMSMEDYSPLSFDRTSKSICKILTRLLSGAVNQTCDALWCPEEDTFGAASFRNESVCGMAVLIATPT